MFSQLFGKYLVDNKVITKEQLDEVISKMENVRAKLYCCIRRYSY